jgi:EAL domain-containing protein (putative c-di-GMP-specific phosphodiesterase class I)/CheY-like chemotaxis protein
LPLAVEASFGIALSPDHGTTADDLIQRADIAMYLAKENGSGHFIYASGADRHSPRRLALMGQLRGAIERDELVLYYQPKINLLTQAVTGAEALVRWRHPEFGLVPPNDFIGPAEQSGLIKPLTAWALKTALRQCPPGIRMAVNLSRRNLHDPRLAEMVADALRNSNVPPSQLVLEITESAIMADPGRALELLSQLNRMGIRLSIDDFGTGYSSMASLKKLPIHEVKIDGVFVRDMATNEEGAVIVRSMVDLAYTLGKEVVAEGVEDQKTMEQLTAMGCHGAQGFYMSKPLPHEEFLRWIETSPWRVQKDQPSADRPTILVADDDPDMLATLVFRLKERGYHVIMANDGVEALDMTRRSRPDLVILDVMMPRENGYRVCRMIKEDGRAGNFAAKIPVILLTGRNLTTQPQSEQRFMDFSHADDIVYKPFEMDRLLDSIGRLLPR